MEIPKEYGAVIITAASSAILTFWQGVMGPLVGNMYGLGSLQVVGQRMKYKVRYPKMYEDKEDSVFNCYQRAHQNTLENYPAFLSLLLTTGIVYPRFATVCGVGWVVGRVLYSYGYYTGVPSKRMWGTPVHFLGFFGLLGGAIVAGAKILLS